MLCNLSSAASAIADVALVEDFCSFNVALKLLFVCIPEFIKAS